jgi:hypothetical protein
MYWAELILDTVQPLLIKICHLIQAATQAKLNCVCSKALFNINRRQRDSIWADKIFSKSTIHSLIEIGQQGQALLFANTTRTDKRYFRFSQRCSWRLTSSRMLRVWLGMHSPKFRRQHDHSKRSHVFTHRHGAIYQNTWLCKVRIFDFRNSVIETQSSSAIYFVLFFHQLCPVLPLILSYPSTYCVLPFHLRCPIFPPTRTSPYPSTNFALSFHQLCPILPPTLPYPSTNFVLSFHQLCPILPPTSILYNRSYFSILVYFSSSNFIWREVSKQVEDSGFCYCSTYTE